MVKSVVLLASSVVLYCYALTISIGQKSFAHDPKSLVELHLKAVSYHSWETAKMQLTPVFRISGVETLERSAWEPTSADDAVSYYKQLASQLRIASVSLSTSPITPEEVSVVIKKTNGSTTKLHYHLNIYGQIDHLDVEGEEVVSRLVP